MSSDYNDPIYNNVLTNNGHVETPDTASQVSQQQKDVGYTAPSTQEPSESYDHFINRTNSFNE